MDYCFGVAYKTKKKAGVTFKWGIFWKILWH